MDHQTWLKQFKDILLGRKFELEFEVRLQRRWMLLDINKEVNVTGGRMRIIDYITMLEKDANNLETRIKLVDDILEEYGSTKGK